MSLLRLTSCLTSRLTLRLPSRLLAGLLLPLLIAATPARAADPALTEVRAVEGITEYRLPNGLQVLLAPDDSKPTTTVNLTFRVGSRHERYGETGMAHLLEHLLFKGTQRHGPVLAEFDKRGMRANGTTSSDRTNYFASFAADEANLRWYLDWLADATVNSRIARTDLDSEMTVVRNEMERNENSPGNILFEKLLATMYQWHNYGHTTIGARADVENVDIGSLQAFYRTWYQPDNATLIVSGRFDPARVRTLVGETFGPIPAPKRVLPRLYTIDPVQDGERAVTLRRVGGAPQLMVGYHSVPGAHPDHAAAELLTLVMGDSPGGRLHRQLTERGLAAGAWGWSQALHDPGWMLFGAELAPGQDPAPARDALLATLEGVGASPITDEELQRARTKWLNDWDRVYGDPELVGVSLSEFVSLGDWRLFFLVRDRVRALPLAELQRFAAQRLLASSRTLATYLPTERPVRAPAPANVDVAAQLEGFKPQAAAAAVASFVATPAAIEARVERGSAGGVRWALLPKPTRGDTVTATLRLRLGDERSLLGQGDVGAFMAAMLDKGGAGLTRQQVQDRLDTLRSTLSIGFGDGVLVAGVQARRDTLPQALELLVALLRQPAFDASVLEELRRGALAGLEQAATDPGTIASIAVGRQGNPYPRGDLRHVRTVAERVEDAKAVTIDGVKAFHARFVGAQHAEFAAVGDFDATAVRAVLERTLAPWRAPQAYARIPRPLWTAPPARLVFATPDKQNATLVMRQAVALSDRDADYVPLAVANFALGGGAGSRLWQRVREQGGLSYDVGSGVSWNRRESASTWEANAIFAPANLGKVETAFREEISRALKDGFTAAEVDVARNALLSFRQLQRAQDGALAGSLANYLDLERTLAFDQQVDDLIRQVPVAEVNAALRRHLKPDGLVTAVAGDFKP